MNRKPKRRVVADVEPREKHLEWPWWSTWAVLAIVLTSIITVAATINDIW